MEKNLCIKFRRFNGIVLLSLLLLFCFSCQKEKLEANLPIVLNDGIEFHDGRLIFKDVEAFKDHQKWIFENQDNPRLITEKNKSLGLISMTEYYFEGISLEESDPRFLSFIEMHPNIFNKVTYDNSTLYLLPHSKLLCYVANKDGIFQIGDKINRIVWNYIYEISDGNDLKTDILLLPMEKLIENGVKIIPSKQLDSKNDYGQRTRYFSNNKYRIVSSLLENIYLSVWYNDIQTNPQKKTLGVWFGAQLNTKSANGDGYKNALNCPSCPELPIYASYTEDTGLTCHTVSWGDYQLDMEESYCPAYSRGRLNSEYIYVYWYDMLDSTPSFYEPNPNWIPGVNEPF